MNLNFFINEFQHDIWSDHYRFNGETIEGMMWRLASGILHDGGPVMQQALFDAMMSRRISFGGRVIANTNTSYGKTNSFNCYGAQRAKKPYDSIQGIFTDLLNAAEILKTEGGIGFNFNHIRPRGTLIKGVRVGTPGVVSFMDIYNVSADVITRGDSGELHQDDGKPTKKKIRKGAQMAMLDCRHPEIIDFIEAKKIPGRLTKFNMSVIVTDKFMEAVAADDDWELWFPDIRYEKYDELWDGDFDKWEEAGLPKYVYKTIKACDLWELLLKNTYTRNEPGIYFIDSANRFNNLIYYQKVTGTYPCVVGNTVVKTDGGDITIQELCDRYKAGDKFKALTMNTETLCLEYENIVFADKTRNNTDVIKIELDDDMILELTPDHKVFTENRGYVEAALLNDDDILLLVD